MRRMEQAIIYATEKHRNDLRKCTNIPYIVHPFSAMFSLRDTGVKDQDVLIATLLHDVIEDTNTTYEDIALSFGEYVADLVASVSENKSKTWSERKLHTIEMLSDCSYQTKLITLADKFHNLQSISCEFELIGNSLWERFNRGYTSQMWYYCRVAEVLSRDPEIYKIELYKNFKDLVKKFYKVLIETPYIKLPMDNENKQTLYHGEGILEDGTSYLSELYTISGVTNYVYYFIKGKKTWDQESLVSQLEAEGLIDFYLKDPMITLDFTKDLLDRSVVSLNIVIGDAQKTYCHPKSLITVKC